MAVAPIWVKGLSLCRFDEMLSFRRQDRWTVPRRLRGGLSRTRARHLAAMARRPSAPPAAMTKTEASRASWECAACGKETSCTGHSFHGRHIGPATRQSPPATPGPARARQLQECLLLHKLRRAMVDQPAPCVPVHRKRPGHGRPQGKMLAVELSRGRAWLAPIGDFSPSSSRPDQPLNQGLQPQAGW